MNIKTFISSIGSESLWLFELFVVMIILMGMTFYVVTKPIYPSPQKPDFELFVESDMLAQKDKGLLENKPLYGISLGYGCYKIFYSDETETVYCQNDTLEALEKSGIYEP